MKNSIQIQLKKGKKEEKRASTESLTSEPHVAERAVDHNTNAACVEVIHILKYIKIHLLLKRMSME